MGEDLYAYNSSLMFTDTFTKVMNTHAIKAGISVERARKDQNFQNNEAGEMIYSNWGNGTTGNVFADTLTARPTQATFGTKSLDGNFQLWNIDFFLQDSWKVKKNFTLEYGARFSKMTNNIERNGIGARFDATRYVAGQGAYRDDTKSYMNGVAYAELGEVDKNLIDTRPIYIMPRVNFAYDIKGNGDLIVRGGAGLFYNRPMGNAEYDVIKFSPYAYSITMDAGSTQNFPGGRMDYNTMGQADPFAFVGGIAVPQSVSVESADYPRYFTTSLSVGKRLPWQQFLEVGYVGTFGRHLLNSRNDNIVPEGALTRPSPTRSSARRSTDRSSRTSASTRRSAAVGFWEYNATSNYHSLQTTLSRQTSGRFQYFATYTFSKVLGMINSEYTESDPFFPRERSYGVLSYDRTHVANLSWNYMAPDLTKSENGFLKGLLNGWQLSGISNFSSGIPIRVGLSGDIRSDGMQNAWFGSDDVMGETPGLGSDRDLHLQPADDEHRRRLEAAEHRLPRPAELPDHRQLRAAVLPADSRPEHPRPDHLQELRARGQQEAADQGRCVQHLQPGLPDLQHRLQRPRPHAADDLQRAADRRVRTAPAGRPTSATRRAGSASPSSRSTTSGRSSRSAGAASSSSP